MNKKCLIVVDAQNDFITGSLANPLALAAIPTLKELIHYMNNNNEDIIYTMDTHDNNYLKTQEGKNLPIIHCVADTEGWRIYPGLVVERPCAVIEKNTFGYNYWNNLNLEDYNEIVLCGFVSSICVMANAQYIKAIVPEIPMTIISDASAGLSEEDHAAALQVFKSCQFKVITLKEYMEE